MIDPSWPQIRFTGLGVTAVPVHEVDVAMVVVTELWPEEHGVRLLDVEVLKNTVLVVGEL